MRFCLDFISHVLFSVFHHLYSYFCDNGWCICCFADCRMENIEVRGDNQPTAERPEPEEAVQQITGSDDSYKGAMAEWNELSAEEKADCFIGKALASLEQLKTECGDDEERKSLHASLGLCLKDYYTLQKIELHMLATHIVSAEKVGVLYKELEALTGGSASGFEAYEELSASLSREKEALEDGSTVSGSGDMAQPQQLSVQEEAACFIGKVLSLLEELKAECRANAEKRSIHDSFGLCLEEYYTLQEIEAYMLATHGVSAEKVVVLYKELVARTGGNARGGEAYEELSVERARLRRGKKALEDGSTVSVGSGDMAQLQQLSVKEEARTFIGKVLQLLVELSEESGGNEETKSMNHSFGVCVSRFYTLQEIEAHMLATQGISAEHVGLLYKAVISGTGDASGGEAYEKHSIDCARLRRENEAQEEPEAPEERSLSGRGASTSGRK